MTRLWTRRQLIQTTFASGFGLVGANLAFAEGEAVGEPPARTRALELVNTHTLESVQVVYWHAGAYAAAALTKLRHVLRDHRNNESHDIEPALFDQLHGLAQAAGRDPRFEIISGYRSPESNARMASASTGVAKHSLHMQGRAIDVRLRGYSTADLRDLALAAKQGGVGYYQRSNFVHLDTGRFRAWNG